MCPIEYQRLTLSSCSFHVLDMNSMKRSYQDDAFDEYPGAEQLLRTLEMDLTNRTRQDNTSEEHLGDEDFDSDGIKASREDQQPPGVLERDPLKQKYRDDPFEEYLDTECFVSDGIGSSGKDHHQRKLFEQTTKRRRANNVIDKKARRSMDQKSNNNSKCRFGNLNQARVTNNLIVELDALEARPAVNPPLLSARAQKRALIEGEVGSNDKAKGKVRYASDGTLEHCSEKSNTWGMCICNR